MVLPLTPDLVRNAAQRLAGGGWRFTIRQLYYASCADAEVPRSHSESTGAMTLGVLLLLVALILIGVPPVFFVLLSSSGLFLLYGATLRLTRRSPGGRVLGMSFSEFERRFSDLEVPGLLHQPDEPSPSVNGARPVLVVCDTGESAAVVAANLEKAKLDTVAVTDVASLPDPGSASDAAAARGVVALHDASPRGCALPLELRDRGFEVIDCGLRPAWLDAPVYQVIEGAPARMPRDLSSLLDPEEIAWLGSGRRLELATLTPDHLMHLLSAGLAGGPERAPGIHVYSLDRALAPVMLGARGALRLKKESAPARQ